MTKLLAVTACAAAIFAATPAAAGGAPPVDLFVETAAGGKPPDVADSGDAEEAAKTSDPASDAPKNNAARTGGVV